MITPVPNSFDSTFLIATFRRHSVLLRCCVGAGHEQPSFYCSTWASMELREFVNCECHPCIKLYQIPPRLTLTQVVIAVPCAFIRCVGMVKSKSDKMQTCTVMQFADVFSTLPSRCGVCQSSTWMHLVRFGTLLSQVSSVSPASPTTAGKRSNAAAQAGLSCVGNTKFRIFRIAQADAWQILIESWTILIDW